MQEEVTQKTIALVIKTSKLNAKYAQDCKAERAVSKELSLGRSIWKELIVSALAEEKQYDKEIIRDRKEQPVL